MPEKDINSINRRKVLQKAATASIVSLGVGSAVGSASAKQDDKLTRLKNEGVVLTQREISSSQSDKQLPADVRTGKRLLSRLVADGLLERASLNTLPDPQSSDGQVHRVNTDGQKEISFTTPTPKGRLQVIFGENSVPSAALFTEDKGVVMYTAPDGRTYERSNPDLTVPRSDDLTTAGCNSCGGCDCVDNWCLDGAWPKSNKTACAVCRDSECIITNSCGC